MKITQEEFIERVKRLHNNKYSYEKTIYQGVGKKVTITCSEHGDFEQLASSHLQGKGCMKCGKIRTSNSSRSTKKQFVEKAKKVHGDRYDYSQVDYINVITKVKINCNNCMNDFWQKPNNHLNGHGCRKCSYKERGDMKRSNVEDFVKWSNETHDGFYDYSKSVYTNALEPIEIICPDHGSFWQTVASHCRGHGCPSCSGRRSGKEAKWLDSLGIESLQRQYRIDVPDEVNISKRYYFADGYDPSTNTVYEFDGKIWHGCPESTLPDDVNFANGKTMKQLNDETFRRNADYERLGYELVIMTEHEWDKIVKKEKLNG